MKKNSFARAQAFNSNRLPFLGAIIFLLFSVCVTGSVFAQISTEQKVVYVSNFDGMSSAYERFKVKVLYEGTQYIVHGGNKSANRMMFGVPSKTITCLRDLGQSKKYGYLDTLGNWVIQPIYDNATDFFDGLAIVCKCEGSDGNGQYYSWHILPNGEKLYQQKYVDVHPFYGEYAIVDKDGGYHMCHINKKGQPLYPQTYQWLYNFNDVGKTLAIRNINISKDVCTWVVLNTSGKELYTIQAKYSVDDPPKSVEAYLK